MRGSPGGIPQVPRVLRTNCSTLTAGHKAIYLSGGGVALASLGLPDLGVSTLDDVVTVCALQNRSLHQIPTQTS